MAGRTPHDHDHAGHGHGGHDHAAHDHGGHDHAAHDHGGHDHAAHDQGGHDRAAHDHGGHDHGGHGHSHAHLAAAGAEGERRVRILLALQITYMIVEVVGGLWSGSLALLADAGHMTTDAAAMVVVLFAIRLARRPASPQRTWGYHRAEIIGATVNGAALLAVAAGVLYEAWERLGQPHTIAGGPMFAIAAGGLLVNLVGLWLLGAVRKDDLNLRAAWMHALSDAAGSVAAMIAGVCVWAWGWTLADSIASVLLAGLVLRGAWMLLDDSLDVLMEGAPAHIDVTAVREALRSTPGVLDVHDLHVWTIASGQVAMSGHVVTASECPSAPLLRAVQERLREQFGISHATIQVEPPGFEEVGIHP